VDGIIAGLLVSHYWNSTIFEFMTFDCSVMTSTVFIRKRVSYCERLDEVVPHNEVIGYSTTM